MDTKQLRQKILDLAIRGKLVPQDPNDEPASVLLERVKAEKERLIAEGKIKRSKKSATSSDKPHYPFEIPSNWIWATLECICSKIGSGSTPRGSNYATSGIPFFRSQNVYNDGIELTDIQYISEEIHKSMISTEVLANDVLLNITGGSLGRCAVVPSDFLKGNVSQHVCILRPIEILPQYIHCFILSAHFSRFMKVTGSGREGLPKYNLEKMLIPIPPIKEQKRIINKVKEWMTMVITIEKETSSLQENLERTKSLILEQAIKGKLVPQDPADEPAEVLLKRVNPNAVVSADTSHYQHLPQGWCVCKLEDIVDYEQPQRYIVESTEYSEAYKTPVLTAGKSFVIGHTNETEGIFDKVPVIIFDDFTTDSKYVDFSFKVKSSAMKILHVKSGINIKYVYFFMSITRLVGKTHKRYWISEYSKLDIPLPPYNEQCRIVDAIERINNRIDDIAEAL